MSAQLMVMLCIHDLLELEASVQKRVGARLLRLVCPPLFLWDKRLLSPPQNHSWCCHTYEHECMTLLSTGLVPVKAAEEKPPANSSTQVKVPVRTLPPPSAKTQGAGPGGPPAAKRASLSASESSAFMDALLPSSPTSTNPAGPGQTSVSPGTTGAVSARQQALPAGLRVKRKAPGAPATEGSTTSTVSGTSLATSAVSSSKSSSSTSSNTINVNLDSASSKAAPDSYFLIFT